MPTTGIALANTFQVESGKVPAAQIDANFTQCVNALNTLATFGNYYVDSGAANAIVVTVASPMIAAYTAGLPLQINVAAANIDVAGTGATTINVNGLGTRNLLYPSGAAMLPGQLKAGAIINVMFDGTQFQYLGPIFGSGTATVTWTGFSASPPTSLPWRIVGNQASLLFASTMVGTSNATTFQIANSGLPTYLQSTVSQQAFVLPAFKDNGASLTVPGSANITSGVGIFFFPNAFLSSVWTASGNKGFNSATQMSYMLA